MKRIFSLFLIFLIFVGGCAKKMPEPTEVPPKSAKPTASPPVAPSVSPAPADAPATEIPATEEPPERERISRAVTPLLDKSENRIYNINRAAQKINAVIIKPGEVFSFNSKVGKRSAETGYKKATAIIEGEKKQDYGGGVCQLASTVYQAAEGAGLKILERHSHQKEVGYAEKGRDAAVNYGTLDMRFENIKDYSVMVAVLVGQNSVVAEIYKMNY